MADSFIQGISVFRVGFIHLISYSITHFLHFLNKHSPFYFHVFMVYDQFLKKFQALFWTVFVKAVFIVTLRTSDRWKWRSVKQWSAFHQTWRHEFSRTNYSSNLCWTETPVTVVWCVWRACGWSVFSREISRWNHTHSSTGENPFRWSSITDTPQTPWAPPSRQELQRPKRCNWTRVSTCEIVSWINSL